jgi:putative endopeptidase
LPLKYKSIYSKNEAMIEYINMIKLFFKSMNIKNYASMANYVFEFEKSIANIYPNEIILNDIFMKDEKISRDVVVRKFPYIHFKNILSKIPSEIKILIIPENVFIHLNLQLQKATREELQSLILWYKLSKGEIKYSFPDFYFQKENFKNKYFKNSNMDKSNEEQCYLSTIKAFERNLDYNKEIPYEKIYNLISEIKNVFKKNIQNNLWLSTSAKNHAINKINFMRFEIAKPNNIKDWGLEPVLNLKPKKYLNNKKTILQNDFKLMIYQINQETNSSKWPFSPLHTSAFYTSNLNKFFIPYGVLKSHIFDDKLSEKLDYYLLTLTIAHEMSHAFDGNGIEFDAFGNINSWLSENEKLYFNKEVEKMIQLFNAENNDGKLTLDENIADFLGLKISYQTHFPETKKINSNEKRKFFIQYAKNWCGLESEDKLLKEIKKHFLLKLRVHNQMMLSEDFEETFSCQLNQPMTLKSDERLVLW